LQTNMNPRDPCLPDHPCSVDPSSESGGCCVVAGVRTCRHRYGPSAAFLSFLFVCVSSDFADAGWHKSWRVFLELGWRSTERERASSVLSGTLPAIPSTAGSRPSSRRRACFPPSCCRWSLTIAPRRSVTLIGLPLRRARSSPTVRACPSSARTCSLCTSRAGGQFL